MHIVITGASSGIGAALARELGKSDLSLTLVARRTARLEQLASELEARCRIESRDLSIAPLDTSWLAEAEGENGPIDVLINNAGLQIVAATDQVDPEAGEASIRVNLFAPLRLIRAALPGMLERGSGTIVNIASVAALAPTPGMTYYNASKGGLAAASEALCGELRDTGVHVVTVYPGIIPETDMAQTGEAKYESTRALRLQPRGTAAELARRIHMAVEDKSPRVIYPELNVIARHLPAVTRWLIDRLTPPLR